MLLSNVADADKHVWLLIGPYDNRHTGRSIVCVIGGKEMALTCVLQVWHIVLCASSRHSSKARHMLQADLLMFARILCVCIAVRAGMRVCRIRSGPGQVAHSNCEGTVLD
jgi:hypothetical protein